MIGWLYTYPTNWNMLDQFSICQWCPPNCVDRKQLQPTDHVLVQTLVHWVGIKPMTWDSQSQTWTTGPVGIISESNDKLEKKQKSICIEITHLSQMPLDDSMHQCYYKWKIPFTVLPHDYPLTISLCNSNFKAPKPIPANKAWHYYRCVISLYLQKIIIIFIWLDC